MGQGCLADTGHILDQQVSARQQAADGEFELMLLAENDGIGGG
jgi:hypothetical protein